MKPYKKKGTDHMVDRHLRHLISEYLCKHPNYDIENFITKLNIPKSYTDELTKFYKHVKPCKIKDIPYVVNGIYDYTRGRKELKLAQKYYPKNFNFKVFDEPFK